MEFFFDKLRARALKLPARLLLHSNPERAVSWLRLALTFSPRDRSLHFSLYQALWVLKQSEMALTSFEKAVELQPQDLTYRRFFAIALLRSGHYAQAQQEFQYCLANWPPTTAEPLVANTSALLALCQCMQGDFAEAERVLGQARRLSPWDLDILFATLCLYYLTSRLDIIPELLGTHERVYPGYYPTEFAMGHYEQYFHYDVQASTGWYEKALHSWEDRKRREFCAQFFASEGLLDSLVEECMEAQINSGKSDEAWLLLHKKEYRSESKDIVWRRELQFYLLTEDFQRAEQFAQHILEQRLPKDPYFLSILATAQHKQGKDDSALANLKLALSVDKQSSEALEVLGGIQLAKREWEAAVGTFLRLLETAPYAPGWLEELGRSYKNLNRLELARTTFERSVKLDPFNAEGWLELGEVYSLQGEHALAKTACERALTFQTLTPDRIKAASSITYGRRKA
jgi:tetratricopeptide (TPR) repeat protein